MKRLAENDLRHGTVNGYSNLKCRCQPCRDAWADYVYRRRQERTRLAAEGKIPRWVEHGKATTYCNWRCKCRPCMNAHNADNQARRTAARSR